MLMYFTLYFYQRFNSTENISIQKLMSMRSASFGVSVTCMLMGGGEGCIQSYPSSSTIATLTSVVVRGVRGVNTENGPGSVKGKHLLRTINV